MDNVNSMTFDQCNPDEVKGFYDILKALIDYNGLKKCDFYNDIHIKQEESFILLEWSHIPYSGEFGPEFKPVYEDQVIMTEKFFPDNSSTYVSNDDEWKDVLSDWLKKNPGWEKNEYGVYRYVNP